MAFAFILSLFDSYTNQSILIFRPGLLAPVVDNLNLFCVSETKMVFRVVFVSIMFDQLNQGKGENFSSNLCNFFFDRLVFMCFFRVKCKN